MKYPGVGSVNYFKQIDGYSCGTIALMNVLRWSGELNIIKAKMKAIRQVCKTSSPLEVGYAKAGTYSKDLNKALSYFRSLFVINKRIRPAVKDINACLDNGGIIIIKYIYKRGGQESAHFALIVGKEKEKYTMVNDGSLYSTTSAKTLKKHLAYVGNDDEFKDSAGRDERFSRAWLIRKRKISA